MPGLTVKASPKRIWSAARRNAAWDKVTRMWRSSSPQWAFGQRGRSSGAVQHSKLSQWIRHIFDMFQTKSKVAIECYWSIWRHCRDGHEDDQLAGRREEKDGRCPWRQGVARPAPEVAEDSLKAVPPGHDGSMKMKMHVPSLQKKRLPTFLDLWWTSPWLCLQKDPLTCPWGGQHIITTYNYTRCVSLCLCVCVQRIPWSWNTPTLRPWSELSGGESQRMMFAIVAHWEGAQSGSDFGRSAVRQWPQHLHVWCWMSPQVP